MRIRLLLLVVVAISLTVGASIAVVEYQNLQSLSRSFEEGQDFLVGFAHDSIEVGLANGLMDFAKATLERLRAHSTFSGGIIYDVDMTPLLTMPNDYRVSEPVFQKLKQERTVAEGLLTFEMRELLDEDGELMGYMVLGFDLSTFRAEFRRALITGILVGVVIAVPIIFVIMREISKRVRVEEQLRANAADLEREIEVRRGVESQLVEAKEIAEAATEARSRFLANMSHEIRTPMNGIIGFTNLALKTDLTREQRDFLSKIRVSAETLLGLINDILDFSKIDAGKLAIENTEFELQSVLEDVADLFAQRAAEKEIELIISRARDVPSALIGDPLRLRQVLVNLTGNAVKFTERGEILIRVSLGRVDERHASLSFVVRDSGIGISNENLSDLFSAFTQADGSTTRRFGGTGLGLTISRELVGLMGGEIDVESQIGEGTTFSFALSFERQATDAVHTYKASMDLRGLNTLLVDDSATSLEVITDMLKSFEFDVTTAQDGRAGLALLERGISSENSFDLILVDWKMPEMDGLEFAERVRRMPDLDQVPIVMITAFGRESEKRRGAEIRINAFLTKPIQQSVLFNTIMEVFDRLGAPAETYDRQMTTEATLSESHLIGARVLLAEDNEINQELAVKLLEMAGMEVDVAQNGLEAVELVKNSKYSLVLMDMQMPEMDGYDATRVIRNELKRTDLPIIAMTAHAMQGDREKCLEAGMNDYITKPIEPDHLYSTLARWTKVSEESASALVDLASLPPVNSDEFALATVAHLDTQQGLQRVAGDSRLYKKLLSDFAKKYAQSIPEIRTALESQDEERVRLLVHSLKGVAGNLAATAVQKAAESVEQSFEPDGRRELSESLDALELALSDVFGSIESLLNDDPITAAAEVAPEGKDGHGEKLEDIKSSLRELAGMLAESDAEAEDALQKVIPRLSAWDVSEDVSGIEARMAEFDFDGAQEYLKRIATRLGFSL